MILAAGYLLCMYERIVFGELSDFLAGLGDHLTDMTPGRDPDARAARRARRHLRDPAGAAARTSFSSTVTETLDAVEPSAADRHPDRGRDRAASRLLVVLVLARIGWVLVHGRDAATLDAAKAGPRIELAGPRH